MAVFDFWPASWHCSVSAMVYFSLKWQISVCTVIVPLQRAGGGGGAHMMESFLHSSTWKTSMCVDCVSMAVNSNLFPGYAGFLGAGILEGVWKSIQSCEPSSSCVKWNSMRIRPDGSSPWWQFTYHSQVTMHSVNSKGPCCGLQHTYTHTHTPKKITQQWGSRAAIVKLETGSFKAWANKKDFTQHQKDIMLNTKQVSLKTLFQGWVRCPLKRSCPQSWLFKGKKDRTKDPS